MKTNLGDDHILVSPSRTYVLFVEDELSIDKEHVYRITLPDSYPNNEIEVSSYFFETFNPDAKITNCLTYEMYAEAQLAKNFENPFKHPSHPKPNPKVNKTLTISPTRTYLILLYDPDGLKGSRLEKFTLPEGYQNNSDEAIVYYRTVVEPDSHILECNSYEIFAVALTDMFDKEFRIFGKKVTDPLKTRIKYRPYRDFYSRR